jgi:DNA-binding MarR family transcriptional regulator
MADQATSFNAGADAGKGLAPGECVLRHVSRTSRAVVAAYDPALAAHGLTGHQFNLMMTLSEKGPLSVGALAEALGMDASGIPRAIRPLSDQSLIATAAGTDRRRRMLSVTEAGRAKLTQSLPAWRAVQSELMDSIGAERWRQLQSDLRIVRNAATSCSTRRPAEG